MQAGVQPVVHLIADAGFDNYNTTINISQKMATEKKDVVQRFVNATLEGWAEYMKGGPAIEAANAADQTRQSRHDRRQDRLRAQGHEREGIVKSGDALKLGIGAMTDERWKRFYETMTAAGAFPAGVDYKKAYASNSSTRASARERCAGRCDERRPAARLHPQRLQAVRERHACDPRRRPRLARGGVREPARARPAAANPRCCASSRGWAHPAPARSNGRRRRIRRAASRSPIWASCSRTRR